MGRRKNGDGRCKSEEVRRIGNGGGRCQSGAVGPGGGGAFTFQEVDHLAPFPSIKGVQLLQAHEGDVVTR